MNVTEKAGFLRERLDDSELSALAELEERVRMGSMPCEAFYTEQDGRDWVDAVKPPLTTLRASSVVIKPVTWLWKDVLVQSALNSIQGIAGIGKTFLTCAIVAAHSKGGVVQSVQGGLERLQQGRILYLTGDDDVSTTIVPRLAECGADLENIHFAPDGILPPIGSIELEQLFEDCKPSLCILDTLQHFLPTKTDLNSANATTGALQPLKVLAERYQCCIVTIQHVSKVAASGNGGHSVNFGIGSAAVNGLFRSVWTLGRLKDEDGKPGAVRALSPSKTNLVAGDPPSILFELSPERGFLWAGVDHELTAEDLYTPAKKEARRDAPERDECVKYLKDLLADKVIPSEEAWENAKAMGFKERTIERAKVEAGICSCRDANNDNIWVWDFKDRHLKTRGGVGGVGGLPTQDRQDRQDRHLYFAGGLPEGKQTTFTDDLRRGTI